MHTLVGKIPNIQLFNLPAELTGWLPKGILVVRNGVLTPSSLLSKGEQLARLVVLLTFRSYVNSWCILLRKS
jgi:hypothetical protein